MTIATLACCILLLLVLIIWGKIPAFLALILVSITAGFLQGMAPMSIVQSMQQGAGTTLGGLIFIMTFGVMLGSILTETGAVQCISERLLALFGLRFTKPALLLTSFLIGIAMFYNAGFVVLAPLVFALGALTGLPYAYLGIIMAAPLSVAHGYLPPHPGPVAVATIFKADIGKTLLLGFAAATPAVLLGALIFPEFIRKIKANPPENFTNIAPASNHVRPSFPLSVLVAISPVLLMACSTTAELALPEDNVWRKALRFAGDPNISMIIAVLAAMLLLGVVRGFDINQLGKKSLEAVGAATVIMIIVAAGGAFKQVLNDSGMGKDIAGIFGQWNISPLLLGWTIATALRITLGSATVAGMTAAGIVQPMIGTGVSPELMTLSIGAGSLMCSHVNDTGFWMFKEYFGLSIKDTFLTWTAMETIVGITGLAGVMLLDIWF